MNCILLEFEVHQLEKLAMKTHSRGKHHPRYKHEGAYWPVLRNSFSKKNSRSVRRSTSEQSGSQHSTEENKQSALLLEQHKHYSVPGQMTWRTGR